MKIKHKNLRSLKKTNQAQPYPPRDTTAAHRGQTQLVLSKAPSRRCSLQCTTVFICYCEVAATKTCSYSLQDKGERDFLTNTAVFSTSVPLCLQHSLSAITHRRAQSFPLPWLGITLPEELSSWMRQCSDTALHNCNTISRSPPFMSCYGENSSQFTLRSVDLIGSPLEIHWHGPSSHMTCPS